LAQGLLAQIQFGPSQYHWFLPSRRAHPMGNLTSVLPRKLFAKSSTPRRQTSLTASPGQSLPSRQASGALTTAGPGLRWRTLGGDDEFQAVQHSFADDEALARAEVPPQPEEETVPTGPLSLSTRLEYASLRKGEAYNVFGLVSLLSQEPADSAGATSSGDAAAERAPLDVTCVLDVSGSMNGQKIQLVKDAMAFVVDEMKPSDRLSIVTFNHSAERKTVLARMTAEGKDALRQATCRICAGGGTSIAAGLDCAVANMEQRRQRNPVGAIFLLTDGQDSTSRSQVQRLVGRARTAHCALYAFGFGQDHDAGLLSSIAEAAQTPFTFVEQPASIKAAFAGAVGGLMSVAAQGIELRLVPAGGCALVAVHTHFALRREGAPEGPAVVSIPDAFAGEQRNIVVELRVPATTEGETEGPATLLRASARYRAVRERVNVQIPEVTLEAPRTEEPEGEPDAEVTAQRQRVEVTDSLEAAIKHGEEGRFGFAQEVLQKTADRLKQDTSETKLSRALMSEVEDAQSRLSSAEEWQQGGRAEVTDAMWMHRGERCTTTVESRNKCSKSLYATRAQTETISRSQL